MKKTHSTIIIKNIWLTSLSLTSTILLAGCASQHTQAGKAPGQIVSANVITVKPSLVPQTYEVVGTVTSNACVSIASQVMGVVTAVFADEGNFVRKEQMLIEINKTEIEARLKQARSQVLESQSELEEAESNLKGSQYAQSSAEAHRVLEDQTFQRYKELRKRNSVSAQEYDEATARQTAAQSDLERATQAIRSAQAKKARILAHVEQSKAALAEVETQLGYTAITSPIDGIVTKKLVNPGDLATPGTTLLKLEQENYRLEVPVDESAFSKIKLKQPVAITITDRQITATVDDIVPATDPETRSFIVKINLPRGLNVRSGMFGKAQFVMGKQDLLTIPIKSLTQNGQLTAVYLVDESNTIHMRIIKTGRKFADQIEILSGLNKGDRIVSNSLAKVADGTHLESGNL